MSSLLRMRALQTRGVQPFVALRQEVNAGPPRTALTPAMTLSLSLWIFPISGRQPCEPARTDTRAFVPNSPPDRAGESSDRRSVLSLTSKVPHAKETCGMGAACDSLSHKKANLTWVQQSAFGKVFPNDSNPRPLNPTQRPVPPFSGCKWGKDSRCTLRVKPAPPRGCRASSPCITKYNVEHLELHHQQMARDVLDWVSQIL